MSASRLVRCSPSKGSSQCQPYLTLSTTALHPLISLLNQLSASVSRLATQQRLMEKEKNKSPSYVMRAIESEVCAREPFGNKFTTNHQWLLSLLGVSLLLLLLSFGIGWIVGSSPLLWALSIHFLVGTAYSIDDIPDNEGDDKFGIQSLSVHLGQKRVFLICVSLFEMIYRVAILVGATSSYHWSKMITVTSLLLV
ncbi:hypothetical protein V8G54_031300 [Vigna mungo]|uniref:Uncharacterized protein n=1 Tax=Vigna mungo TaxID=3915 RepID=A0AAQ3MYL3_VIGMU